MRCRSTAARSRPPTAPAGGRFYLKDGFRLRHHQAYQVERATFDKVLLDRAKECGAIVREEVAVEEVCFEEQGATVRLRAGAEIPEGSEIRARFVLDCSGRNSTLGRQFGL